MVVESPVIILLAQDALDLVGFIPTFINANDPRSATEQFNANYAHGGGWHKFEGFTLTDKLQLKYPGDPALPLVAMMQLRDETILMYPCAWVVIMQKDKTFEVARLD